MPRMKSRLSSVNAARFVAGVLGSWRLGSPLMASCMHTRVGVSRSRAAVVHHGDLWIETIWMGEWIGFSAVHGGNCGRVHSSAKRASTVSKSILGVVVV